VYETQAKEKTLDIRFIRKEYDTDFK